MTTDAIGFNYIPGSGLTAPLMTFEVNSGGQYQDVTAFVLVGHKTAAGSMALDAAPIDVASQADVDALAGPGSMLREMFRVTRANAPAMPIKLVAVDEVGTAAIWSLTIANLPSGGGVAAIEVCGESIEFTVSPSDTPTIVAANLAAAINSYYDALRNAMLPVTATSAAGVVSVTARHKGAILNDVDFYVPTNISGNVLAGANVLTVATATAGVGTPDLSGALAAIGDRPADFIISPWTDGASQNLYYAAMNDVSGRWAWSRQKYGHVYSPYTGTFSATTSYGLALNDRHFTAMRRVACPTPSWLWIAATIARVAPWLADGVTGNVSRNQTGLMVEEIKPPRDLTTVDDYTARNTLNNSGISTWTVSADGKVQIDKIVTTYRTGPSGQPDTVFRDIQALYQVSLGLSFLRSVLATNCGQKALAADNPGNLAAICTPSDIKASFVQGYDTLCLRGVFQNSDAFAKALVVQIDTQNPDRANVYAPMERVGPFDILAANATIYQKFPTALAA